jgi:hypothetical protein
MKLIPKLLISLLAVTAISANAALYDRGNGMIYDSAQNITWMQDANYAQTSGYDVDGRMTWHDAVSWADGLVYGGLDDWRLASANLNELPTYNTYDGSSDYGYNNTRSEIGHLFFELGNKAIYNTMGAFQYFNSGLKNTAFIDPDSGQQVNFLNMQKAAYWELESTSFNSDLAWMFLTTTGFHTFEDKNDLGGTGYYAWAVRAGDVAAVPVPAAAWLMGSGLIGLAGIARRKK